VNIKKLILPAIVIFIFFEASDFVIHHVLLGPIYEKLINVWRPDMMAKMWIMHLATVVYSFLFVYIFSKGYKGRGLIEGLRYGIVIGFFMYFVNALNSYVIYPLPYSLAIHWFVYGMIQAVLAGIIVALVYRPKKEA